MSSIEKARIIRAEFQQIIVGKGFTEPQAERLTGIEVLGSSLRFPNELSPYGIIDPGRMHNEEFNALLRDFPDLKDEYQAYLRGLGTKFKTTSTFTKIIPIDDEEVSSVINFMFQKSPGKYEIR